MKVDLPSLGFTAGMADFGNWPTTRTWSCSIATAVRLDKSDDLVLSLEPYETCIIAARRL